MAARRSARPEGGLPSYITPEGEARLRAEMERLWSDERPKVTLEVKRAAAHGDRSENAEYIYGKKRLREIDGRLRFLAKRLEQLTVVRVPPALDGRVYFGAWVTVEGEDAETLRYRLVGPDESDVDAGLISIESPVGRALMGRVQGDEVVVQRPMGELTLEIVSVDYDAPGTSK